MRRLLVLIAACALVAAILTPYASAMLQRPTPTVVGGSTSGGTAVAILTDSSGNQFVRATPAMSLYTAQAVFTTNVAWTLQNTTTNTQSASDVLMQNLTLNNNTTVAVSVFVMDGNGQYLIPVGYSIPPRSQYTIGVPTYFKSGVQISAGTANAISVSMWGLQ